MPSQQHQPWTLPTLCAIHAAPDMTAEQKIEAMKPFLGGAATRTRRTTSGETSASTGTRTKRTRRTATAQPTQAKAAPRKVFTDQMVLNVIPEGRGVTRAQITSAKRLEGIKAAALSLSLARLRKAGKLIEQPEGSGTWFRAQAQQEPSTRVAQAA